MAGVESMIVQEENKPPTKQIDREKVNATQFDKNIHH